MKNIFAFALILFTFSAWSEDRQTQEFADHIISVAKNNSEKEIRGKGGRIECSYFAYYSYTVRSNDVNDAWGRLKLLCIKKECEKLGEIYEGFARKDAQLSEEEYRDKMEFGGHSKEAIDRAVKDRFNFDKFKGMTCDNAEPYQRYFAFNICDAMPVNCFDKKN